MNSTSILKQSETMTSGQAAVLLQIPSRTIRRYLVTGKLTGTQNPITKRWAVTYDACRELLNRAPASPLVEDPKVYPPDPTTYPEAVWTLAKFVRTAPGQLPTRVEAALKIVDDFLGVSA